MHFFKKVGFYIVFEKFFFLRDKLLFRRMQNSTHFKFCKVLNIIEIYSRLL